MRRGSDQLKSLTDIAYFMVNVIAGRQPRPKASADQNDGLELSSQYPKAPGSFYGKVRPLCGGGAETSHTRNLLGMMAFLPPFGAVISCICCNAAYFKNAAFIRRMPSLGVSSLDSGRLRAAFLF